MSGAPQPIEGGRDSRRASEPTSENTSYEHFIDRTSANRPLRNSEKPKSASLPIRFPALQVHVPASTGFRVGACGTSAAWTIFCRRGALQMDPTMVQFTREGDCVSVVPLPVKSKRPAHAMASAKTTSVPATGTRFMSAPATRAKATPRG
jgi:hypothetical protein